MKPWESNGAKTWTKDKDIRKVNLVSWEQGQLCKLSSQEDN